MRDHVTRAFGVPDDAPHGFYRLVHFWRGAVEPAQARRSVCADRAEGLTYFMRQRCGQFGDGGEPRNVRECLLRLLQCRPSLPLVHHRRL